MATTYIRPGDTLPVVLGGTVAAGDVDIVGTGLIGVAQVAGVSGDTINYSIEGVHTLPKLTGAVIAVGEQVLWDVTGGAVDDDQATPATGDFLCGYAVEAAGAGVLSIQVRINKTAPAVT